MDIHRCRFVDYTPHAVTALAFSHGAGGTPRGARLAVGRANGDIEIWAFQSGWVHELTLPGARQRSVEGLAWLGGRLFSVGGLTSITEWDLAARRPKHNHDCNAGVIWCIDAAGDTVAVGCDDGSVVLVDASAGLEHGAVCQRHTERVLGVRFYGDKVIGACANGVVRVWATQGAERGRVVGLVRVDKLATEQTLVWAVVPLEQRGQFATGDSTGAVKVWDMATLTLAQSFAVHDADVLAMAGDDSRLYTAGVDRKIHQFSFVRSRKALRWVHNRSRLLHLNDVRAMALYEGRFGGHLVTGGVERLLIVQDPARFDGAVEKLFMAQHVSNVAVAHGLVALHHDQTVKLWRVDDSHALVAQLTLADDDNVTSVAIGAPRGAPRGAERGAERTLAVATVNSVKVFALTDEGTRFAVRKLRDSHFDELVLGALTVLLCGSRLVVHTPQHELYRFRVEESHIVFEDEIETPHAKEDESYGHAIRSLALTHDEETLVALRFNNSIEVLPVHGGAGRVLTRPLEPVRLLATTPQNTVAVLTESSQLYEFNLTGRLMTPWAQRNSDSVPADFAALGTPQGMFVHDGKAWVYSSTWLCFLDMTVDFPPKKTKRAHDGEVSDKIEASELERRLFWATQKYRPILKAAPWGNGILLVEREAFALPKTAAFVVPSFNL